VESDGGGPRFATPGYYDPSIEQRGFTASCQNDLFAFGVVAGVCFGRQGDP
jgi:hypothetical protein